MYSMKSFNLDVTLKAAERFLSRLLKKQRLLPNRKVNDKLRPSGAARRQILSSVEHRSHKGLKNPAENSRAVA
jgi:putative transposase